MDYTFNTKMIFFKSLLSAMAGNEDGDELHLLKEKMKEKVGSEKRKR